MRLILRVLLDALRTVSWAVGRGIRALRRNKPPVGVRLHLAGPLPTFPVGRRMPRWMRWVVGEEAPRSVGSLWILLRDLQFLRGLSHVKVLWLSLEGSRLTPAAKHALADEIRAWKGAGKAIWSSALLVDDVELRLWALADRAHLEPGGRLDLTGPSATLTPLRPLLEKVGVTPAFVRRGEHKTAPEQFTESEVSPAQRRQVELLLGASETRLVEALVEGRKLTPEAARAAIDHGGRLPEDAIQAGLLDAVADDEAIEEALEKEHGEAFRLVDLAAVEGIHTLERPPFRPIRRPRQAVVLGVKGLITTGEGQQGRAIGHLALLRAIEALREDDKVASVVLHIDSPGGSAMASERMHAALVRLAAEKPLLAYTDTVAASGGYMVAMAAQAFWCAEEAVVGSIGVYAGKFDLAGLLAMGGLKPESIGSGALSGLSAWHRGWNDAERAAMERDVEATYQVFLKMVAANRKLSVEEVHARAEGRIYTGRTALEAKLVDKLAPWTEVIDEARRLGGLAVDGPFSVLEPEVQSNRLFSLLGLGALAPSMKEPARGRPEVHALAELPTGWNHWG